MKSVIIGINIANFSPGTNVNLSEEIFSLRCSLKFVKLKNVYAMLKAMLSVYFKVLTFGLVVSLYIMEQKRKIDWKPSGAHLERATSIQRL